VRYHSATEPSPFLGHTNVSKIPIIKLAPSPNRNNPP